MKADAVRYFFMKLLIPFLLPCLVVLFVNSCKHDPLSVADPKDSLYCYIMAGQSNMAGRGRIEAQDTFTNPRILMMDSSDQLVIAKEPLHRYQQNIDGLDCGMSFAGTLLPVIHPRTQIAMIPCAIGSTSIEDWLGDSVRVVPLYSNLIRRAAKAGLSGRLKGILWHQGEANAEDSTYKTYQAHLTAFIAKTRRDIGIADLPFFIGKIGSFSKRIYRDSINAAIDRVALSVPRVSVIETNDLSGKPDSLHFDSKALRILGQRYARAAEVQLH